MEHQFLLIPIKNLLVHEETKPQHVVEVARSIARLGRVIRPIIVEERTLTIIDGHHRFKALRILGARYAPVVLARYGDGVKRIEPPKRVIRVRARSEEEALNLVAEHVEHLAAKGASRLVLRTSNRALVLTRDLESLHRALGVLENTVIGKSGRVYAIRALLQPLEPANIVSAAMRREPFPPKTSIHVTPLKKLRNPIKLSKLI